MIGILIKNLIKAAKKLNEIPILIPEPKEISNTKNNNAYLLTSECTLCFINVNNSKILLDDLNGFLGTISTIKLNQVDVDDSDVECLSHKNEGDLLDANNEECYNLEIDNNQILIYSTHVKGVFYGIQTLIQLIKNAYLTKVSSLDKENLVLNKIYIRDVPDLKIRGVAQDISRGQVFTVENAKRYIEILSHYKMNTYGITYLGDIFAHAKYPEIGKDRGALTIEEIREIDEYAKSRNIDFIPFFQCLGHNDNVLMHNKYGYLGEFTGAHSFDISNPDVIPFLNDYITEISKTFSSINFHIACDESFDVGRYNSKDFIAQ
ncbi:MAG: glycoside hydrolase family 20 zincin-like fold domain-containing protein, partial [Promethearchaeota archaeon]